MLVKTICVCMAMATTARAACVGNDLESLLPQAATVTPSTPRTYFVQGIEKAGCPSVSDACRARAYVVPGDIVVVTGTRDAYACAWLTNQKGTTTENWLPITALKMLPAAVPSPVDWVGHWKTGEQDITILRAGSGQLAVKGEATFGAHDPDRVKRGAVNDGEVEGTAAPQGNLLAFNQGEDNKTLLFSDADDSACRIRMQLAGPYLWAWEQGCGGMGVSFDGVYARTAH